MSKSTLKLSLYKARLPDLVTAASRSLRHGAASSSLRGEPAAAKRGWAECRLTPERRDAVKARSGQWHVSQPVAEGS
jgi:hypothetical protein